MARVIESVEVIHQHPDGPDFYRVGTGPIADIIENRGAYELYDEADNLIMEIVNCPVVVRYKEVTEESEVQK